MNNLILNVTTDDWLIQIFKGFVNAFKILIIKFWWLILIVLVVIGLVNYFIVKAKTKFVRDGLQSKNKSVKTFTIIIIVVVALYYFIKGLIK